MVGLRVTDNNGAQGDDDAAVTVQNQPPTASFTAHAEPGPDRPRSPSTHRARATPTARSPNTNGTSTATAATRPTPAPRRRPPHLPTRPTPTIGLRVTDNRGATATTTHAPHRTRPLQRGGQLGDPGLIDYWRLGETSGTTLADGVGGAPQRALNGVDARRRRPPDPRSRTLGLSFDGTNDAASAPLNLSGTSKLTIEFWLKWTSYANNDEARVRVHLELQQHQRRLPDQSQLQHLKRPVRSRRSVAVPPATAPTSRGPRPASGTTTRSCSTRPRRRPADHPLRRRQSGRVTKGTSGTGAGNFANSTLNFMSRNGSSLFGKGSLDEVAIYDQALTATQISQHFSAR